jgi:putative endonuclease
VPSRAWTVYLAQCADRTLYCGIARDVTVRIRQHDAGRGARYTRGRGPLTVLVTRQCRDQGFALRIERAVKQLTRAEKLALVSDPASLLRLVRRVRRVRTTRTGEL